MYGFEARMGTEETVIWFSGLLDEGGREAPRDMKHGACGSTPRTYKHESLQPLSLLVETEWASFQRLLL